MFENAKKYALFVNLGKKDTKIQIAEDSCTFISFLPKK